MKVMDGKDQALLNQLLDLAGSSHLLEKAFLLAYQKSSEPDVVDVIKYIEQLRIEDIRKDQKLRRKLAPAV